MLGGFSSDGLFRRVGAGFARVSAVRPRVGRSSPVLTEMGGGGWGACVWSKSLAGLLCPSGVFCGSQRRREWLWPVPSRSVVVSPNGGGPSGTAANAIACSGRCPGASGLGGRRGVAKSCSPHLGGAMGFLCAFPVALLHCVWRGPKVQEHLIAQKITPAPRPPAGPIRVLVVRLPGRSVRCACLVLLGGVFALGCLVLFFLFLFLGAGCAVVLGGRPLERATMAKSFANRRTNVGNIRRARSAASKKMVYYY